MGQAGASDDVERARRGDGVAFAALYRSHVAGVEAVVRAHLRNGFGVDDVVQETFVRALEGIDRLADDRHFKAWLFSIARHVAIDHGRLQARTTPAEGADADETPDSSLGPDVMAELSELTKLVRGCVVGLSRRDAVAIGLVTYLNFSPAEVGAALGITPGAAKVLVHRARRRLRDALVLELMVRRRGAGCTALEGLLGSADPITAGRHVRTCRCCQQIVSDEVRPYSSSPVTVIPSLRNATASTSGNGNGFHGPSVRRETSGAV